MYAGEEIPDEEVSRYLAALRILEDEQRGRDEDEGYFEE